LTEALVAAGEGHVVDTNKRGDGSAVGY